MWQSWQADIDPGNNRPANSPYSLCCKSEHDGEAGVQLPATAPTESRPGAEPGAGGAPVGDTMSGHEDPSHVPLGTTAAATTAADADNLPYPGPPTPPRPVLQLAVTPTTGVTASGAPSRSAGSTTHQRPLPRGAQSRRGGGSRDLDSEHKLGQASRASTPSDSGFSMAGIKGVSQLLNMNNST